MNSISVKNLYNRFSSVYDILFSRIFDPARKMAIQDMKTITNDKIIEIGVGTGLSFKHYNRHAQNISLTGIDLSEKMLDKAKTRSGSAQNINISLNCVDGEKTQYPDSTFDKVVLMYVYSVTPNPESLLKEAFRICKDSGSIHIINHFSRSKGQNMNLAEKLLSHQSEFIGFQSDFSYADNISKYKLTLESEKSANLFSLTKIIYLKKKKNLHLIRQN